MKTNYFFWIALSLIWGKVPAQDLTSASLRIPSTYARNSLTLLVLDCPGEKYNDLVKEKANNIVLSSKFYDNNIEYISMQDPCNSDSIVENSSNLILEQLTKDRVANKIVAKWYSKDKDGNMSLELIHSRGMFNASDEEYLQAKSTKRGNALLEDYGNRLIDRSYILVLHLCDIKTMAAAGVQNMRGWQCIVSALLYKIDYNQNVIDALYNNWIYEEDDSLVRAGKIESLDGLNIPLVFVNGTALTVQKAQSTELLNSTVLALVEKPKTDNELFDDLVQASYDETLRELAMIVENFRVVTTIHEMKPIRVKIGRKEGLKVDDRFFAYEYVYDDEKDTITQVLRGVIRSTSKIANNEEVSSGKSPTTRFYQVGGKKLHAGYLLQQDNDEGLEAFFGKEIGEIGGAYARMDGRVGRRFGIRALFVYVEGGINSKKYKNFEENGEKRYTFLRYGFGIAKGLQLTRNTELRPYIGYGHEQVDIKTSSIGTLKTVYLRGGSNIAFNLNRYFQIIGGAGYYHTTITKEKDGPRYADKWYELFDGRTGFSLMCGLKLSF